MQETKKDLLDAFKPFIYFTVVSTLLAVSLVTTYLFELEPKIQIIRDRILLVLMIIMILVITFFRQILEILRSKLPNVSSIPPMTSNDRLIQSRKDEAISRSKSPIPLTPSMQKEGVKIVNKFISSLAPFIGLWLGLLIGGYFGTVGLLVAFGLDERACREGFGTATLFTVPLPALIMARFFQLIVIEIIQDLNCFNGWIAKRYKIMGLLAIVLSFILFALVIGVKFHSECEKFSQKSKETIHKIFY